ncbi:MAG: 3-hydroxybutyryl-CoA dehydrogenase [Gammaproteobacteria bacterium]|nr:3-hydroxybutyryl-CoA dehydrogenase [Gammaproteobacteria bacterium]
MSAREFETPDGKPPLIAAVGMGRMGRGIALTFAYAGLPVVLVDLKERPWGAFETLRADAQKEIRQTLSMLAGFGLLENAAIDTVMARIRYSSLDVAAAAGGGLADADVVFEGVPETLDAKESALKLISGIVAESAIVTSTTSTILSTELQGFVHRPERFLNAHWLNPAYLVPLVELSPGEKTDPSVIAELKSLLESIGKVPVVCKASPGYIVPRIQALAMNEAARMVEEGVASAEDIDKATRYGFGFRFAVLGLLEFIDWGGGDILYHASRYMVNATGEQRHASPDIIADNMREGRTGLRAREGFMDYADMDVEVYQKERLAAFVAMLRHIDKLPVSAERQDG